MPENSNEDKPLFDGLRARNYVVFVKNALTRHKRLVAIVFVAIVASSAVILACLPRSYHVEAKVLAHSNAALTVRSDAPGADVPTRTAAETILRRDALVALVQQHDLVRHYREHRAPLDRARDAVTQLLSGTHESEQDRIDTIVDLLDKHLLVWTNESGSTVTIAIDWPSAEMAVRIVDSAQQNYLESRYAQEVTALSESIGILQSHTASSRAQVDNAVTALQQVRIERDGRHTIAPQAHTQDAPTQPAAVQPQAEDPEIARLKASIDAKQRTVADLEEFRRRRLTDLQARLAEQQAIYTEHHPVVVDLTQAIAAMTGESPQVKTLRSEISTLKTEYDRHSAVPISPQARESMVVRQPEISVRELPNEVMRLDPELREERDPNILHARGQLRDVMDKDATLQTRIQATEIDLDTAKAAFKYRYAIITPAHIPKKPAKPNTLLITLASIIAAIFVAGLLAVVSDLRTGRLVERWQLERILERPIIADIELPQLLNPEQK